MPRAVLDRRHGHDRPRRGARARAGRLGGRRASRAPATLPEGLAELGVRGGRGRPGGRRAAARGDRRRRRRRPRHRRVRSRARRAAQRPRRLVGSLVVISTASVYADDEGRALDGEGDAAAACPCRSSRRSAPPSPATRRTRRGKAELEQTLLDGPLPATAPPRLRDPRAGREAAARALLRRSAPSTGGAASRSRGTARAASTRRRSRISPS